MSRRNLTAILVGTLGNLYFLNQLFAVLGWLLNRRGYPLIIFKAISLGGLIQNFFVISFWPQVFSGVLVALISYPRKIYTLLIVSVLTPILTFLLWIIPFKSYSVGTDVALLSWNILTFFLAATVGYFITRLVIKVTTQKSFSERPTSPQ